MKTVLIDFKDPEDGAIICDPIVVETEYDKEYIEKAIKDIVKNLDNSWTYFDILNELEKKGIIHILYTEHYTYTI